MRWFWSGTVDNVGQWITLTVRVSLWWSLIFSRSRNCQPPYVYNFEFKICNICNTCSLSARKVLIFQKEIFWKNLELQMNLWRLRDLPENCHWCQENRQLSMHTELLLFLRFFDSSRIKQHNKIPCVSCRF